MLTHIYIKDLVIVSTLDLALGPGMTALTGETGAGKSILIDALGLALGDKADNIMIRSGCERAEVSAELDLSRHPQALEWLADNGLEEGLQCILRRRLTRDARARGFINGRPVTQAQLQALGALLVDIHGQHAHQSLLRPVEQRQLLDAYGGCTALARQLAERFRQYRATRSRLEQLEAAARDRAARLELLSFQREELEHLAVSAEELRELDEEQRRLRNLDRLQEGSSRLLEILYDEETGIERRLGRALAELDGLLDYAAGLTEPRGLVESALIQIQEAAGGLRGFVESLDLDPQRLEVVEQRLSDIHDAARKLRVPPEGLPQRLEELCSELQGLERADSEVEELRCEVQVQRASYLEQAALLSAARHTAAEALAVTVSGSMQTLAMDGGTFSVQITPLPEDQAGAGGLESIEFLVSANPGQPLQPLARVASGGELSRISLAIQVATAECGQVPTLIFDEVDVGIGGGVAEIVGQLLRHLGAARQVLCVTHLPQVAAQAHHHLQVKKETRDGHTLTAIRPLGEDDRVAEVARMLGGLEITDMTLAHAREMLGTAEG
jgi:DNA repair protein RecN (Recombination protein N)